VWCEGCSDPALGDTGVSAVAVPPGTGAFDAAIPGLTRGTQYTVRAYATNQGGTGYSAATTFTTSPNRLPTASAGGPYTIDEGASLTLGATASDPDPDILTYAWSFDGGAFDAAVGPNPTLSWTRLEQLGADGGKDQTVQVRVNDGYGTTTSTPATLNVRNVPPTGTLTAPANVAEGATATVSVGNVTDPSKADRDAGIRYGFDLDGDGTYEIGGATYATATTSNTATIPAGALDGPSTRKKRAVLVDKDGGTTVRTATITVGSGAPTATAADVSVDEGATATVGLTAPADPAGADEAAGLRYAYDLDDDGTFESARSRTRTPRPTRPRRSRPR
jgi:hypothetical protein